MKPGDTVYVARYMPCCKTLPKGLLGFTFIVGEIRYYAEDECRHCGARHAPMVMVVPQEKGYKDAHPLKILGRMEELTGYEFSVTVLQAAMDNGFRLDN